MNFFHNTSQLRKLGTFWNSKQIFACYHYKPKVNNVDLNKKLEKLPFSRRSNKIETKSPPRIYNKEIKIVETTTPNVYTADILDPTLHDLTSYRNDSIKYFGLEPTYVSPSDFNYSLPVGRTPEFAFIGRSNTGKSSLVRALLGDRCEVRVSKTPGCTQSLNFYAFQKDPKLSSHVLSNHMFYLVDLPGYGFARASKEQKMSWASFTDSYLQHRDADVLRRVYLLIDARRGITDTDLKMMRKLEEDQVVFQIVLTKCDLIDLNPSPSALNPSSLVLPPSLVQPLENILRHTFAPRPTSAFPFVHLTSSETGLGVAQLQWAMSEQISYSLYSPSDPHEARDTLQEAEEREEEDKSRIRTLPPSPPPRFNPSSLPASQSASTTHLPSFLASPVRASLPLHLIPPSSSKARQSEEKKQQHEERVYELYCQSREALREEEKRREEEETRREEEERRRKIEEMDREFELQWQLKREKEIREKDGIEFPFPSPSSPSNTSTPVLTPRRDSKSLKDGLGTHQSFDSSVHKFRDLTHTLRDLGVKVHQKQGTQPTKNQHPPKQSIHKKEANKPGTKTFLDLSMVKDEELTTEWQRAVIKAVKFNQSIDD